MNKDKCFFDAIRLTTLYDNYHIRTVDQRRQQLSLIESVQSSYVIIIKMYVYSVDALQPLFQKYTTTKWILGLRKRKEERVRLCCCFYFHGFFVLVIYLSIFCFHRPLNSAGVRKVRDHDICLVESFWWILVNTQNKTMLLISENILQLTTSVPQR